MAYIRAKQGVRAANLLFRIPCPSCSMYEFMDSRNKKSPMTSSTNATAIQVGGPPIVSNSPYSMQLLAIGAVYDGLLRSGGAIDTYQPSTPILPPSLLPLRKRKQTGNFRGRVPPFLRRSATTVHGMRERCWRREMSSDSVRENANNR